MAPKRKAQSVSTCKGSKAKDVVIEEAPQRLAGRCNLLIEAWAAKLQKIIEDELDIKVLINEEKPRKGTFEARSSDGKIFISLLSMPRPFTALRNLDIEKTAKEIISDLELKDETDGSLQVNKDADVKIDAHNDAPSDHKLKTGSSNEEFHKTEPEEGEAIKPVKRSRRRV